jgi:hypothetical protein
VAQATTTHTGTNDAFPAPARRVARQPDKGAAGTGTPIFDERSRPGDVSGSPGADRTSPAPPALVKASCAQIAIGVGRQADPAASNEGSSLGKQKRLSAMCPLGSLVRIFTHDRETELFNVDERLPVRS